MRWLICFLVVFAGCQSQPKMSEEDIQLIQRQRDSIAGETERLRAENENMRAENEKREAAEKVRQEQENKTFSKDAILGGWKVRLSCTESDCKGGIGVGDIINQQWNIDYLNSQYSIMVLTNSENTNKDYMGSFDGKWLRASFEATTTEWATYVTARVKLDLKMIDENHLVGTRTIANIGLCSRGYKVEAEKM